MTLKEYISKQQSIAQKKEKANRLAILKKLEIGKKVTSEDWHKGYNFDMETQLYYTIEPEEVSDEEWEEIKKYIPASDLEETGNPQKKNGVAIALKVIGFLTYTLSLILGFVALIEFPFIVTMFSWVLGGILGTFVLGSAEIIQLLQDIKDKK